MDCLKIAWARQQLYRMVVFVAVLEGEICRCGLESIVSSSLINKGLS
jgi:hypothetical protein